MANEDLTDFNRVDEMGSSKKFVSFLDSASGIEAVKAIKRKSFELLDAKQGDHLLEVGCGTGDDAKTLAKMVSPEGKVVAIDNSEKMIAEAKKRQQDSELPIDFIAGDTAALDFDSEVFDGCHFERLLVHTPDPARAVKEMVRVLRSGGHLVAFEADLETLVLDSSHQELTRKILRFWCDNFQNAYVARHLPAIFQDCGIVDIYVEPRAAIFDFNFAKELIIAGTLQRAQEEELVTAEEARLWLSDLEQADEEGRFFCANMGFIVSGRKP